MRTGWSRVENPNVPSHHSAYSMLRLSRAVLLCCHPQTHEIGLRAALGASRGRVLRLVLGQAGFQLGVGMVIGIGLSIVLARGLSFILFGVGTMDWGVFGGVAVLLTVTATVACLVPARRATRVDPLVAMQTE